MIDKTNVALRTVNDATAVTSSRGYETNGATGTGTKAQQFEAIFLKSMVELMMPKNAPHVFGHATGGQVWKSFLSEQIGNELAKSGTFGVSKLVDQSVSRRSAEVGGTTR